MLAVAAAGMLTAAAVMAALAAAVWRRHGNPAALSLAVLLVAVGWWGLAYALELASHDLGLKGVWGDAKYAGTAVVGPAWLTLVLAYTGRSRLVTRRLVTALAVEPVLVMLALVVPATHDLVRYYPASERGEDLPVVATGPLFWVHFAYSNALVLAATALFVVTMLRLSRLYWRLAATLVGAALLPWAANLAHNFGLGPFARIDLTPFAFIVTGGVLVWGLHQERLVNLSPVARDVVVESMTDGVLVLDVYGRIVDANRAAAHLLGSGRRDMAGRHVDDLLPPQPHTDPPDPTLDAGDATTARPSLLTLTVEGQPRHIEARTQPVTDRRGKPAGQVVMLRDVTTYRAADTRLRDLLAERSRIATALEASLHPAALPTLTGLHAAATYQPAGDGREIGGDFYDMFPLDARTWGVVLGDVSGKGAEAAAVTAQIRYTLRVLAAERRWPTDVLRALNDALLRADHAERFATLVYAVAEPTDAGWTLALALGGHPQPLLRRTDGTVTPVGEPGTALGLFDDVDLHTVHIDLTPGDVLCLFTDGLTEARHGTELFGEHRAAGVLRAAANPSAQDLVTALHAAALEFRGGPLSDDLAVLALNVPQLSR